MSESFEYVGPGVEGEGRGDQSELEKEKTGAIHYIDTLDDHKRQE